MSLPRLRSTRPVNGQIRFEPGLRIAVIGAGISGVCSAAHLLRHGLRVTVFERSEIEGGVWHFDERVCDDPSYPSEAPSVGDYHVSLQGQFAYRTLSAKPILGEANIGTRENPISVAPTTFSPPGPCYRGLRNNIPTTLMVSSLAPWPIDTPECIGQKGLEEYIQILSREHGVADVTAYNTRVDEVRKSSKRACWIIRTVSLQQAGQKRGTQLIRERLWEFDAVVVASGHYNLPRIPDIPGLRTWKDRFGDRVIHSKQYRGPEKYQGKNVLVIGGGVSSLDICRELYGIASASYQSVRGGMYDLPASMLPPNTERVPEVAEFSFDADGDTPKLDLTDSKTIPGSVVFSTGRILTHIHHVIVATGYITSYPFLSQFHSDDIDAGAAGNSLLVTSEGSMVHNLHKDIFYIEDPTLSFVGAPYHVATFSLFDFQAQVVARVFSGDAQLPSRADMRKEYEARVKAKGLGRSLHSLHANAGELAYVNDLVSWMNEDVVLSGATPMQGHSNAWIERYWAMKEEMKKIRAS